MPEPLSQERARQKFEELRPIYSEWHRQVRENRRFYNREFANDVVSPEVQQQGFIPVVPRTARRSIDEAVDHILYRPKVKVPVRPTESSIITEQEIAEKKRKFLAAWWRQVEQRSNVLGDGRKELITDGAIAVRQTLNWDLVPDMPKRRTQKAMAAYRRALDKLGAYGFLWDIELLDNEWVYLDPTNHRDPQYAYVAYDILTEDAKRRFPEATGEWRDNPWNQKVKFLEYWSAPTFKAGGWEPGQHIQWIETDCVKDVDNPYPYVPIAMEDSGWGSNRLGATPHDRFVGLNDHSHHVFVAQARQWSALEAVTEVTAFAPVIARNLSENKLKELRVGPGAIWNLEGSDTDPERESLEFAKWPEIPATVLQLIGLIDREVNTALKSDTLGGIPQSGVDTATEADQNVRNAAAKLTSPVAALQRLAAKMSRWALMDVELTLEAPVTVYGTSSDDPADVRLTPREINGYYDVSVELRTADEEAMNLTKARFWGDMYNVLPFLSAMTAMERGEIADDPMKEMLKRAAEDAFQSEPMAMARIMAAAQAFGEEMVAFQQMMAGSGGGGMGPPPGPPSDQRLVQQEDINAPVQARVTEDAYRQRDTDLMGAENLAA